MNKLEAIQQIAIHYGISDSPIQSDGFYKKKFKYRKEEKTASAGLHSETGHVNDFGGGTIYFSKLVEDLNIDYTPDDRHEVPSTKRKYESLKDYAVAHALTSEQLESAKWSFTMYTEQGKPIPALTFQTHTGQRWKFLDGSGGWRHKGKEGKYKTCWYLGKEAIELANKNNLDFIVLCNAEISSIAGQAHGIPAFTTTGGENKIPDDKDNDLLTAIKKLWTGKIILALDCDTKGKDTAKKIQAQLPNSIIVDLMLSEHADLADFCKLYSTDSLNELKRLFNAQNPVDAINTHETDYHMDYRVAERLTDKMTGKTPIIERAYLHPIASFQKFGGYMRICKSGKVDLYAGSSGTGKTQLMETMNDKRNGKMNLHCNWFGDEWSEEEMLIRRVSRWSQPHLTYDMIELHQMYLGCKQDGMSDAENYGTKLTDAQMIIYHKYIAIFKSWKGKTEFFGGEPTLDDTILSMACALERRRRNGQQVVCTVFDYAQLLRANDWKDSNNRTEGAAEQVKKFSSDYNIHVDMPTQVNKDASRGSKEGKSLKAEDAHYLRPDKFNGYFSLDRQFVKDGDDYIETPLFWLSSQKNSLGGTIEGFKYPRVPIMMIPSRLYFETRLDAQHNWTRMPQWSHIKGNEGYTGQDKPYIDNNKSILDNIPS